MSKYWLQIGLLILVSSQLLLGSPAEEKGNRLRRKAPLTTEKQLTVEVTSYTGNFYLYPGEPQLAYDLAINYKTIAPVVTYNRLGDRGYLNIKSKAFSKKDEEEDQDADNFNFDEQDCELYVTPAVPLDLRLKFGVVQGELELGGLQVNSLQLSAGVSKTLVIFSEPNPIFLQEMRIESGVGKLKMEKLGNANFQNLDFEGGIGASVLDFSGNFRQQARLNFNVGIGKVTLYLPRKVGIRLKINKSFFSSVHVDDVYKKGGYYYNENWGKTSASMDIVINAGIGRVVIKWLED